MWMYGPAFIDPTGEYDRLKEQYKERFGEAFPSFVCKDYKEAKDAIKESFETGVPVYWCLSADY